jgi:hypothetical protein
MTHGGGAEGSLGQGKSREMNLVGFDRKAAAPLQEKTEEISRSKCTAGKDGNAVGEEQE